MSLLKKFQKTASVTRNLLKVVANTEYAVRFAGEMHLGKEMAPKIEVDQQTGEVKKTNKQPAYIAFVDNLDVPEDHAEGYEEMQMICATVLRKELEEQYPNHSYVGKCFVFSQQKVDRGGNAYNVPQITEVADPNPTRGAEVRKLWEADYAKRQAQGKPGSGDPAASNEEKPADTSKGGKKK